MSQQATQPRPPATVTASDLAYGASTARLLESEARAVDSREIPAEPVRPATPATRTRRRTTPAAKPGSAPRARRKTTRATKPAPIQEAPQATLLLGRRASRKKWEAARREGIGGSDVAALFGLAGKWSSPRHVFEEKHGRPTFRETEPAEIGREIESFVARMFTKRSGLKTRMPAGMIQNIARPWMRANVDRYVLDAEGNIVAPLELKNRSEYQAEDWEDGVPDGPLLQLHWYLAVGGWDHGYVAALVGGNKLKWYRVERDEEIIDEIVDHCEQWFQRHVVEGFPPPADGLEATTSLLARLWEVQPEKVINVPADKASALLEKEARMADRVDVAKEQLRKVQNEMRLLAGDAEIVRAGGKPAWTNKQNSTFSPKKFHAEYPVLAAKFTHKVDALDMDRLKAEASEEYRLCRARQLRIPKTTAKKAS
ncbi:YqaJ viral recombinase family protein [Streptomyces sp. NBC_00024]|uniref:YqaJ viral recombinase family nuclease n=1 Tax=Streptomyces sp. NBC_00024 TaxID=2903612 RepID=UPI00324519CD